MNNDSLDTFDVEYRHETVIKFIKDLIDGRVRIPKPKITTGPGEVIIKGLVDLTEDIENYVSGNFKEKDRNQTEFDIFAEIVLLATSDRLVRENNPSIYDEIQRLHDKIDSTNDLLKAILIELTKK